MSENESDNEYSIECQDCGNLIDGSDINSCADCNYSSCLDCEGVKQCSECEEFWCPDWITEIDGKLFCSDCKH